MRACRQQRIPFGEKFMPRPAVPIRVLLCLAGALAAGCSEAPAPGKGGTSADGSPLTPVTLVLNWYPEAEHGGYYAAEVHGYYQEEGLDVRIIPGGPNAQVLQQVAGHSVTFGVENADRVLLARAAEADVVAVMAPLQTSPRCLMVHRQSGITRYDQLKNMTLALSSSAPWVEYLKRHATLDGVQIVPYSGSVAQFLLDPNYAQQAYIFSEPFVAEKQGGDPHCLLLSDLGYNPYTSVLITHGDTAHDDPELVKKMTAASVRGWQTYLERPDETNRHIGRLNTQIDGDVLDFGAQALKPLCTTDDVPMERLGEMTAARWQTLAEQLAEVGALERDRVEPQRAFTTRFLPRRD